jgi:thiamine pyrophosphate-dependent acetolactate synthase large subunit-like protein
LSTSKIDRRDLLPVLFPSHAEYLFVSGLAGSARDLAALTRDGPHLFALGGAMGAAATIGLGMAMAAPDRKVVVVTGDGELQMNVGSLITIANAAPPNLTVICIDNERHGETGNQPGNTSRATDLAAIAKGAGFQFVMTVADSDQLLAGAHFVHQESGPRFLVVKVLATEPSVYKRLMDPAECRYRFKAAFAIAEKH